MNRLVFVQKILSSTDELSGDYKKEIGEMQRAMRKIKESPFYSLLMSTMQTLHIILLEEMEKEK